MKMSRSSQTPSTPFTPLAYPRAADDVPDPVRSGTDEPVVRFHIASWEIGCCSPRPVVGQPLDTYKLYFSPAGPDTVGWSGLDEDVDLDALPREVFYPPTMGEVTPDGRGRHVRRGHLLGEFHTSSETVPAIYGTVVRTRIVVLDRVLGSESLQEGYPPCDVWRPVPESLRLREVTGPDWDFEHRPTPGEAQQGDVTHGHDEGVWVDLLVQTRPVSAEVPPGPPQRPVRGKEWFARRVPKDGA